MTSKWLRAVSNVAHDTKGGVQIHEHTVNEGAGKRLKRKVR